MALAGTGAVCIWNDIAPEGREDFYAWHIHEHMPERAAIPGFERGRRYCALDEATRPEFFTLYETRDPAVLVGAAYRVRLDAPTAWTRKATRAFRNTARALVRVEASLGPGPGGLLATLRFALRPARAADAAAVTAAAAGRPQVTGAHLCLTDQAASAERSAESRDRTDIGTAPASVVLIEACTEPALRAAAEAAAAALAGLSDVPVATGFYRFEYEARAGR